MRTRYATMARTLLAAILFGVLCGGGIAEGRDTHEYRTWTSRKGQKLRAKYVGVDGKWVLLRVEKGRHTRVRRTALSAADVRYLESLASTVPGEKPTSDGLMLHLDFEGNVTAPASGPPIDSENVTFAKGQRGQACKFSGEARIRIGPIRIPPEGTWAAWVNVNPALDRQKPASVFGINGAGISVYKGEFHANFNDGRKKEVVIGRAPAEAGQWTHLALTWGQGRRRFYVNGAEAVARDYSGTPRVTSAVMLVGCRWAGKGKQFLGLIDELRLYDRSLKPKEIAVLAGGGPAVQSAAVPVRPAPSRLSAAELKRRMPVYQKRLEEALAPAKPKLELEPDGLAVTFGTHWRVDSLAALQGMSGIVRVEARSSKISSIAPLKGLRLRHLDLRGAKVSDLSPLAGMPLEHLDLAHTKVSDISILKGMELEYLDIGDTYATGTSVLRGMPLKHANLASAKDLRDLKLLAGMPLTYLNVKSTDVTDLRPLAGMSLRQLVACNTHVSDIATLRGMPLEELDLGYTEVSDVSALRGAPLTRLSLRGTKVAELAPLAGAPLRQLVIAQTKVVDLSPLRGMPLEVLKIGGTLVRDLSPIKGAPLKHIELAKTHVTNLRPLRGMPIVWLEIDGAPVSDLTPLRGMGVEQLRMSHTKVTDVTVLKELPKLKLLILTPSKITKGLDSLRGLENLDLIGASCTWTPEKFWDKFAKGELKE